MRLKNELKALQYYTKDIENELIKNRVIHVLEWYVRKATFYKDL